jgi:hypothetical protein
MSLVNILPKEHWGSYELRSQLVKYGYIDRNFLNSILKINKKPKFPPFLYWRLHPNSSNSFFYKLYKNIALTHKYTDRSFDIEHSNFLDITKFFLKYPVSRIDILERIEVEINHLRNNNHTNFPSLKPVTHCPQCINKDLNKYGITYFKTHPCKNHETTFFIGCPICDSKINNNDFYKEFDLTERNLGKNALTPEVRIIDTLRDQCRHCNVRPSKFSIDYQNYLNNTFNWLPNEQQH